MFLFREILDGWASWGNVFQSMEAFAPLIEVIRLRHGLPDTGIGPCTPGTNAVFRACGGIVKIFAPAETGMIPTGAEAAGLRHSAACGIEAPRILAGGELRDRYIFPYLVMEELSGREAGDVLPGCPEVEKQAYAEKLKILTGRLNVPPRAEGAENCLAATIGANIRWNPFPNSLRGEALALAEGLDPAELVFVHGDLTGENVLVGDGGALRLIDFGDSQLAPACYEWPPLVFELFRRDPVLLDTYFGWDRGGKFLSGLTEAVLLHDFGGDFALKLCREQRIAPERIAGRRELGELIRRGIPGRMS